MGKGARPQTYGLIGWPVKHSYSAFMHNAAFRHYKINAEYKRFPTTPEQLKGFFERNEPLRDEEGDEYYREQISGFNVTMPHKEIIIPYLKFYRKNESFFARQIQAVNTVKVKADGSLFAANTDVPGFERDLKEKGFNPVGKKISLFGAGGGAKAVALALAHKRAKKIFVFDVDKKKAAELAQRINQSPHCNDKEIVEVVNSIKDFKELKIRKSDLLINATPVGMKPDDDPLIEKEWLHPGLFVYDLIYNPSKTKLLKAAKEAKCSTANGSGMLLYQGVLAFRIWFPDKKASEVEVVMRQALSKQLEIKRSG